MIIDNSIRNNKALLIQYFRDRASEFLAELNTEFGKTQYKQKARKLNTLLVKARVTIIEIVKQKAKVEHWHNTELLEGILMVTYCNYLVMLEARHTVWEYEYMSFSRRIGELWEPFCKIAFEYPINDLELFVPPLFSNVKKKLENEIEEYINELTIRDEEKQQLLKYYHKVWGLVISGEIQLELDLHFIYQGQKYVVDFKSGFGSNEKGNTNRLLLVASIYQNMEENYNPLIFVRSEDNNNYFNTLKDSGIWKAYCGIETYDEIHKYTGYDLKEWIDKNATWGADLSSDFSSFLKKHDLSQYLTW